MKPLNELSLQEYQQAKSSGIFWVWYPKASGNIDEDLDAVVVEDAYNDNGDITKFFYDIIDQEAEYDW